MILFSIIGWLICFVVLLGATAGLIFVMLHGGEEFSPASGSAMIVCVAVAIVLGYLYWYLFSFINISIGQS